MMELINDFNSWLLKRPGLYEGYWFWMSVVGVLMAIAWGVDVSNRAFDRRLIIRPLAVQAQAHLISAIICAFALACASILGWRAIEDNPTLGRYFVLSMLFLITAFVLLITVLWGAHRVAQWRLSRMHDD